MDEKNKIDEFRDNFSCLITGLQEPYEDLHKSIILMIDSMDGDRREELYTRWNLVNSVFNQIFNKL